MVGKVKFRGYGKLLLQSLSSCLLPSLSTSVIHSSCALLSCLSKLQGSYDDIAVMMTHSNALSSSSVSAEESQKAHSSTYIDRDPEPTVALVLMISM